MDERLRIDVFCEDTGHEQFTGSLLRRIARDLQLQLDVQTRNSRGGHGRALREFRTWQRAVAAQHGIGSVIPDLLVLIIDANCTSWFECRRNLAEAIESSFFPAHVIGCPDPHIERWCFADPQAIQDVLGCPCPADPGKCERAFYKRLLRETIRKAGQPILTGEMEYAPDLIEAMDLFRAGKNQHSLGHFIDEIRGALRRQRFAEP
ncbi:MAG TPA: hypothetical protein VHQ90_09635 [Thermoanaerobaculia bacterium]|nr:hypothetical protein [Thermoanaerobaculia bacterium]